MIVYLWMQNRCRVDERDEGRYSIPHIFRQLQKLASSAVARLNIKASEYVFGVRT